MRLLWGHKSAGSASLNLPTRESQAVPVQVHKSVKRDTRWWNDLLWMLSKMGLKPFYLFFPALRSMLEVIIASGFSKYSTFRSWARFGVFKTYRDLKCCMLNLVFYPKDYEKLLRKIWELGQHSLAVLGQEVLEASWGSRVTSSASASVNSLARCKNGKTGKDENPSIHLL